MLFERADALTQLCYFLLDRLRVGADRAQVLQYRIFGCHAAASLKGTGTNGDAGPRTSFAPLLIIGARLALVVVAVLGVRKRPHHLRASRPLARHARDVVTSVDVPAAGGAEEFGRCGVHPGYGST